MSRTVYAPATMLIANLPMNGGAVPLDEIDPAAWVGKPVTIDHPAAGGEFIAARSSDHVGVIANAWMQDGRLMGTLKLSDDLLPADVIERIEREQPLDVSVGFYSERKGDLERNLEPDHLALLPNTEGACSWADGCGLRARSRSGLRVNCVCNCGKCEASRMSKTITARARGHADDPRQIRADLISSGKFHPDNEQGLQMMTQETLIEMRDRYLGKPAGETRRPTKSATGSRPTSAAPNPTLLAARSASPSSNCAPSICRPWPAQPRPPARTTRPRSRQCSRHLPSTSSAARLTTGWR